jgi:hypothetical protein
LEISALVLAARRLGRFGEQLSVGEAVLLTFSRGSSKLSFLSEVPDFIAAFPPTIVGLFRDKEQNADEGVEGCSFGGVP